ncbi:PH domain-containing protein [Peribacillus acanthi]|uniref:PH domain-containing protein n=1 Tax=Peribacillus acanthi TaxID=2171554 RepID=UPI000D3E749F|nr:PH domain-containing protein [Peribacillus acanthi]
MNTISQKAIKVWRLSGFLYSLIGIAFAIGLTALTIFMDWPNWIIGVYWLLAILDSIFLAVILPSLRWKWWRYEVREGEIDIQKGIFVVKKTLFPMNRVQHVDTKQGPIYRKYGLSTVIISTAATIHEIPAIESHEADELRRKISSLASVGEDDV